MATWPWFSYYWLHLSLSLEIMASWRRAIDHVTRGF
jgi:hypothetical protein